MAYNSTLEKLGLSLRSCKALRDEGIITAQDLIDLPEAKIKNIVGVGARAKKAILLFRRTLSGGETRTEEREVTFVNISNQFTKQIKRLLGFDAPCCIEAERALLGKYIVDSISWEERNTTYLFANDFYCQAHKEIYGAMLKLYSENSIIDLITLSNELQKKGKLDAIGGQVYLLSLVEDACKQDAARSYAKIIHDHAHTRFMIEVSLDKAEQYFASPDTFKEDKLSEDQISTSLTPVAAGPLEPEKIGEETPKEKYWAYIKAHNPILEVAKEYIKDLFCDGIYWRGTSPFSGEQDTQKRLTINPSKNIFYCWASHMGGDVIVLVSKMEKCTFNEAVQKIYDRMSKEDKDNCPSPS